MRHGLAALFVLGACDAPQVPVHPERAVPASPSEAPLEAVPTIDAPVTDLAGLLTADELADLDARVRAVRDETGVQMALLTVPALPRGMPIEDFSLKVAEQWGGGSPRDDGLLVTLAWGDRRSRIEVGYGLEGYVTDGDAGQLLVDAAPYLRANDTAGALGFLVDELHGRVASLRPGEGPSTARRAYAAGLRMAPPREATSLLGVVLGGAFAPWLAWTRRSMGFPGAQRHWARLRRGRLWLAALAAFGTGSLVLWGFGPPLAVAGFLLGGAVGAVVHLPLGFASGPTELRMGMWTAGILGLLGAACYVYLGLSTDDVPAEITFVGYGALALGMVIGATSSGGGGAGGGSSSQGWSGSGSSGSSSSGGGSSSGGWSGGGGGFGGGGASGSW